MEYISVEDLKKWKAQRVENGNCNFDDIEALSGFIASCERLDIVRCAECKYNTDDICRKHYWVVKADGFCEKGER